MEVTRCPWCTGEIARDDERKATGHSDPVCKGFMDMIATSGGFARMTIDLVDDDNDVVESFPTTTGPRVSDREKDS